MTAALGSSIGIVAYLALFAGVGVLFLFVNLLVGKLIRPADPYPEKLEIYECGEPTIGSSFVQFDLRFYVVALLFIIFDVEVAFFFPWATVFGKTTNLADERLQVVQMAGSDLQLTPAARGLYRELGVRRPRVPTQIPPSLRAAFTERFGDVATIETPRQAEFVMRQGARQIALITIVDIGVFFAVLLVGFAYVWKRGDLDWVRAVSRDRAAQQRQLPPQDEASEPREPALSV